MSGSFEDPRGRGLLRKVATLLWDELERRARDHRLSDLWTEVDALRKTVEDFEKQMGEMREALDK